jgi:hypothetical protein
MRKQASRRYHTGDTEYWKLRPLVHVRDSFKGDAQPGVAIADPRSHAPVARAFLADYTLSVNRLNCRGFDDFNPCQAETRAHANRSVSDAST